LKYPFWPDGLLEVFIMGFDYVNMALPFKKIQVRNIFPVEYIDTVIMTS